MLSDLMNVGEWAACKQADQGSYPHRRGAYRRAQAR